MTKHLYPNNVFEHFMHTGEKYRKTYQLFPHLPYKITHTLIMFRKIYPNNFDLEFASCSSKILKNTVKVYRMNIILLFWLLRSLLVLMLFFSCVRFPRLIYQQLIDKNKHIYCFVLKKMFGLSWEMGHRLQSQNITILYKTKP